MSGRIIMKVDNNECQDLVIEKVNDALSIYDLKFELVKQEIDGSNVPYQTTFIYELKEIEISADPDDPTAV